jgi:hypothetical protein
MRGALFLVNNVISSTNIHLFAPTGPPSLEKWMLSFGDASLVLLFVIVHPFKFPLGFLFLESCQWKKYIQSKRI